MKTQLRRVLRSLVGPFIVCLMSVPAFAIPVNGFLGFGGPGVLSFSTGGGAPGTNFIDWCPVNAGPEPGVGCGVDATGSGVLSVDSRTGDFVPVDPLGSPGTLLDITDDPTATGAPSFTYIPLGPIPGGIAGFLDFADPWTYTLTSITPQVCAPSANLVCTGYFSLLQVGSNVSVNLAGKGTINAGGDISNFDLLITGNFSGTTIQQVITAATSPSGIFSNSWSGELNATAIPEPGSISLALMGLALLGGASLRKQRKL